MPSGMGTVLRPLPEIAFRQAAREDLAIRQAQRRAGAIEEESRGGAAFAREDLAAQTAYRATSDRPAIVTQLPTVAQPPSGKTKCGSSVA